MATWLEIEKDAPEFAERVRSRFAVGTNKTIATLRKDGSPRISGTELVIKDGEVTLGMMGGSRKLADVRRDPRVAIHSPTIEPPADPSQWAGEAKLAGRLVETPTPEGAEEDSGYFRVDVTEVVLTFVGGNPPDHLVIESWHEGAGYRRRTRK